MMQQCGCKPPRKVEIRIDDDRFHIFELGNTIPVMENDYNKLKNKPSIGGKTLEGDLDATEFVEEMIATDLEVEEMIIEVFGELPEEMQETEETGA